MNSTPATIRSIGAIAVVLLSCLMGPAVAQVNPDEIRDQRLKALEKAHLHELRTANLDINGLRFPLPLLLSRYVGLDPKQQPGTDTRGLEFVNFHDRTILKVSGNYNAAYNAALLTDNERAGRVLQDVISPMLGVLCRDLSPGDDFSRLGFEISFHVRRRARGYDYEGKEILVLVLARQDAAAYLKARDTEERQAILDRSEVYLNGKPYGLLLGERDPYPLSEVADARSAAARAPVANRRPVTAVLQEVAARETTPAPVVAEPAPTVSAHLMRGIFGDVAPTIDPINKVPPPHESSPDAGSDPQKSYQSTLDRMVQELQSQAHFVTYAPPSFIHFHGGLYLQLSMTTTLPQAAAGSQYRLAALAFDQHIAHLIRPVLAYFKDRSDFDGIDFSTTVRLAAGQGAGESPLSVEFIFPLKLAGAYADFDSTGQQLIEGSFVLINGERVGLNLQAAEAVTMSRYIQSKVPGL